MIVWIGVDLTGIPFLDPQIQPRRAYCSANVLVMIASTLITWNHKNGSFCFCRGGGVEDFPQAHTIIFSLTVQVSFLKHGGGGISLSSHLSPSGFCCCLKGIFQSGVLPPSAFLALVSALLPEVGRLWQSRRWSYWIIWVWNPRTVVKTYRGKLSSLCSEVY